ncbi:MAG: hypothetical protein JNK85_03990 [Verrucomicrobiales bacterium]|nr:hypothetical protein [Verrucomicrobiales bacterium]
MALHLAGLCTNATPRSVLSKAPGKDSKPVDSNLRRLLESSHLPQGSPSSPMLANLAVFHLDRRLEGLANTSGATFSRYADDLLLSGGVAFARNAHRTAHAVNVIALQEGFEVNTRKTRIMRRANSQRAAGLVLNQHPNLPRTQFDRLKATLFNCVRHGPDSQNRQGHLDFRAHLQGRLAHLLAINPNRGRKLKAIFDRIRWDAPL